MDETFGVTEETDDRSVVVALSGEIDVAAAPTVRERLEQAADGDGRSGRRPVRRDLHRLDRARCAHRRPQASARRRSRPCAWWSAEPRILKVFEITGLTDLFAIVPSLAEATSA